MPEEELVRSFVVRHQDLEAVIEVLAENGHSESNQHLLVLGPRGMGKTTLVNRVISEVRRNPARTGAWLPIAFDEESYTVTTAGELWALALTHLAEQTGDRQLRQASARLQKVQDHQQLGEAALARLLEYAGIVGKRILLVLENIDMLFEQQMGDNEAWKVRHSLQNLPSIMVLATAPTRLESFHDSKKPLYELFREYTLERLDLEECRTVWKMVTDQDLPPHQARPIQIFTGGNTRLLVILASFARGRSFRALMDDLVGLIDEHTPYFKHNVEALPSAERKVFVTLADIWSPATSRQVADQARGELNQVSALLGRLAGRGAVEVVRNVGPVKLYQVVERMYNLYHLLRRRGEARVRGVVEFMVRYYDSQAMRDLLDDMANEACTLGQSNRTDHVQAFLEIIRRLPDADDRRSLIAGINPEFIDLPEVATELSQLLAVNIRPDRSEDELRAALSEDPHDIESILDLASLFTNRGAYSEAIQRIETALDCDPSSRRIPEVFSMFVEKLDPSDALAGEVDRLAHMLSVGVRGDSAALVHAVRAWWLARKSRKTAAMAVAASVVEQWPSVVDAVASVGALFLSLGSVDLAREALEHALDVEPSNRLALVSLTHLSQQEEHPARAEHLLREFVRYYPNDEEGWCRLIAFLKEERYAAETADAALLAARAANPDSQRLGYFFADHLRDQGRLAEAEREYADLAIRLHYRPAFTTHVACLDTMGAHEQAKARLHEYLRIQESAHLLTLSTFYAIKEQRVEDARRTVEYVREAYPTDFATLIACLLLDYRDQDFVRARADVEAFLHNNGAPHTVFGILELVLGEEPSELDATAVEWARRGLAQNPVDPDLNLALARCLARTGRWTEIHDSLTQLLATPRQARKRFEAIVALGTEAAAHAHGELFSQLLATSPSASLFAPLIVACRRAAGLPVESPQEVDEVADDILRNIANRRMSLNNPDLTTKSTTPPAIPSTRAPIAKKRATTTRAPASHARKTTATATRKPKRRGPT
ncbi:MAG: AAA family ATPase [Myxococcales bacterium]|nr:AAA family ATPase [Myxococcales bacterium]